MLEIIPYQFIGCIRFGMSADELTAAIGKPVNVSKNRLGETEYKYPAFRVALSAKDGHVVEVGVVPDTELVLDGIRIFSSRDAFDELAKKDGDAHEYAGFVIFPNLGITMTGFHDNDESQKAVTVFAKGRWDSLRSKFKKYHQAAKNRP